jgi:hypothetical protein
MMRLAVLSDIYLQRSLPDWMICGRAKATFDWKGATN